MSVDATRLSNPPCTLRGTGRCRRSSGRITCRGSLCGLGRLALYRRPLVRLRGALLQELDEFLAQVRQLLPQRGRLAPPGALLAVLRDAVQVVAQVLEEVAKPVKFLRGLRPRRRTCRGDGAFGFVGLRLFIVVFCDKVIGYIPTLAGFLARRIKGLSLEASSHRSFE